MPTSSLNQTHPDYSLQRDNWRLMRDSYGGQKKVKSKTSLYLPPHPSHIIDGYGTPGSVGQKNYDAYLRRARYHNFVKEAVQTAVGMMHSQPALIEVPPALQSVRSSTGEPLQQLLRRINFEQLLTGRLGLMVDLPSLGINNDTPYIALYAAERILNWDEGAVEEISPQKLNLVVLDETQYEREAGGFSWVEREKYRVLALGSFGENEPIGQYRQGLFEEQAFLETDLRPVSWKGRSFEEIPFIFVNSTDLEASPDDPVLLDLADLCMTMYQTDGDYRHNLFMQGQDTFVTIGANIDEGEAIRTGSGARIDLPLGGDAKYVGVNSSGLSEQRQALSNLEARAGTMGAQTLDSTSRERESGASMHIRVAARTADLNQIADAGALALERSLKLIARLMDEDESKVKVVPNKEFGDLPLTGQTMVEISTARKNGWPISAKTMHDLARKRKVTTLTFEEEQALVEAEKGTVFEMVPDGSGQTGDGTGENGENDDRRVGNQLQQSRRNP